MLGAANPYVAISPLQLYALTAWWANIWGPQAINITSAKLLSLPSSLSAFIMYYPSIYIWISTIIFLSNLLQLHKNVITAEN